MKTIKIVAHNLRSSHNVGSLLRTAEGLGIDEVILTGYTPYPVTDNDARLPHVHRKISEQIKKTALGAEDTIKWRHAPEILSIIDELQSEGYYLAGLEQTAQSTPLPNLVPPDHIAFILGREVEGLEKEVLERCDATIEIPMFGKKESFNVVQAAAMAMYHSKFYPFDNRAT